MSDTPQIDWKWLSQLEQQISSNEHTAIRSRWEFGRWLVENAPPETGGRGKTSVLSAIANELLVSYQELRARRRFAFLYSTEEKLDNALTSFRSWHEIVSRGLRGEREPAEQPPFPEGTFPTIVADPPWQVRTGPAEFGTSLSNLPLDYPTMPLADIEALPVVELAAPDAHLYLWTINAYVEAAYSVARAWGFKPSTLLVWCKTPHGLGLGGTYVLTTEYILYATRGSLPATQRIDTTWFQWARGIHSAKPDEFYQLVELVSPGPYVDLFARREREGWTVWGNEVAA